MAVRAKRVVKGEVIENSLPASDILDINHPLHANFVKWLGDKEQTKRQARKYLQEFPALKTEHSD
jgi:hypothetical protein